MNLRPETLKPCTMKPQNAIRSLNPYRVQFVCKAPGLWDPISCCFEVLKVLGLLAWGLGFRVLGFRIQGLGLLVTGLRG